MTKKNVLKAYIKAMGLRQDDVAKIWNTSKSSAWRKLTHPEKITLGELATLFKQIESEERSHADLNLLFATWEIVTGR